MVGNGLLRARFEICASNKTQHENKTKSFWIDKD